jgi:hypothetical protein
MAPRPQLNKARSQLCLALIALYPSLPRLAQADQPLAAAAAPSAIRQACLSIFPAATPGAARTAHLSLPPELAALSNEETAPGDGCEIVAMAPTAEPPPQSPSELRVLADEYGYSADGKRMEATGHVHVTFQTDALDADRVVLDMSAQTAVAEGNVRQLHAGQEVRAERLEWSFATQEGRAFGAVSEYRGVIVHGKEIHFQSNQQQATQASFTTCDRPRPHYQLTARSITLVPGQRVVARGVGVWLLGVRLLTIPRLQRSLRPGRGGESLFPTIGYNAHDGVFVTRRMDLVETRDYRVQFDGKLAMKRGFLGGVQGLQSKGTLRWIAGLDVRQQAPNQRVRFLEVDRLPEAGVLWAPQAGVRSRFLPIQVQNVDRPAEDEVSWLMLGQVTLGYFRQRRQEFRGDVAVRENEVRLDGRLLFAGPALRVGGVRLAEPRVLARGALYGGGNHLLLLGVGLERSWKLGRDLSVRLERFAHVSTGRSPFLFDEIEIRNEWRPHAEIRSGLNTFSYFARYDADRKSIFDQEFAVARVLHCLEPRISYRVRSQQIGLDIRIVGLQGSD